MEIQKVLTVLLLASSCRTEETPVKPEAAGIPSSSAHLKGKSSTMTEDSAIAIAKREAEARGHRTGGLNVSAKHVDGTWEVSFYTLTPGAVGGGHGFMVRLKDPGGAFIDLRRFQ